MQEILCDACCLVLLTPTHWSVPEFGQMVQAKSEEEDAYMQHYRAPFKYDDNPNIISHKCSMSLPE